MDQAERLKYFNLQAPPPFAETILKTWQEEKFRELELYVIEEQRHGSASVNVFRVVGTRHPDYAGKSWLDLLIERAANDGQSAAVPGQSRLLPGDGGQGAVHALPVH